jgi:hypothetical protein
MQASGVAGGRGDNVAHSMARFEPMTLGNMRANGVRSLDVSCWICHYRAVSMSTISRIT